VIISKFSCEKGFRELRLRTMSVTDTCNIDIFIPVILQKVLKIIMSRQGKGLFII
jgi:hypothetical protein